MRRLEVDAVKSQLPVQSFDLDQAMDSKKQLRSGLGIIHGFKFLSAMKLSVAKIECMAQRVYV
jgi:hypothetical protein